MMLIIKQKKVKVIDDNYKQTLVNRALLIRDQIDYDSNSPEVLDERFEIEYGDQYIKLKRNVHHIKDELIKTKYPDLQLTDKNSWDIDCELVRYMKKLLDNNDYPSSEDIEDIIFNSLNVYDDISIIDAQEYVNKKEKRQAEREELEKLQDIESKMYDLDDK